MARATVVKSHYVGNSQLQCRTNRNPVLRQNTHLSLWWFKPIRIDSTEGSNVWYILLELIANKRLYTTKDPKQLYFRIDTVRVNEL